MSFVPDHVDHLIHVFLTFLMGFGFNHDTDDRLRTGFPDKNTPGIAEGIRSVATRPWYY